MHARRALKRPSGGVFAPDGTVKIVALGINALNGQRGFLSIGGWASPSSPPGFSTFATGGRGTHVVWDFSKWVVWDAEEGTAGRGVFRRSADGFSFDSVTPTLPDGYRFAQEPCFSASNPFSGQINAFGINSSSRVCLLQSADGGANWAELTIPGITYPPVSLAQWGGSIGASFQSCVYQDGTIQGRIGLSDPWITTGGQIQIPKPMVRVRNQQNIILGSDGTNIIRSVNDGLSWNAVGTPRPYDFAINSSGIGVCRIGSAFFLRTVDYGLTWSPTGLHGATIGDTGAKRSIINAEYVFGANTFVALEGNIDTASDKILYSEDGGITWQRRALPANILFKLSCMAIKETT